MYVNKKCNIQFQFTKMYRVSTKWIPDLQEISENERFIPSIQYIINVTILFISFILIFISVYKKFKFNVEIAITTIASILIQKI